MDEWRIAPAAGWMPHGLAALVAESHAEGIRNVDVLIERWVDGSERFDDDGEALWVAIAMTRDAGDDEEVVGIGGLSRCPTVPGALRVRRFYVSSSYRRRGVARSLADAAVGHATGRCHVITCNARASDAAGPFWESMGFTPVDVDGITHVLTQRG